MATLKSVDVLLVLIGFCALVRSLPILESNESKSSGSSSGEDSEDSDESKLKAFIQTRNSTKDLYVVKAVVYEIGILTDSSGEDNSTEFSSEERVDLTFFDARHNSSHINLGRVPFPIQTNISGQVLTGIAPVDLGAFSDPTDLLKALPISGTIVNITHSDTGYFELKTRNLTQFERPHVLSVTDLKSVPQIFETIPDLNTVLQGSDLNEDDTYDEDSQSSSESPKDNFIK